MTQGDVMVGLAVLIGTCLSAWSLTMAYGLLFPARCELARYEVSAHPWKCVGRGALVLFTVGLFSIVLAAKAPNPGAKLLGWLLVLTILSVAALGMAGIAFNAGDRLRRMAPDMTPYASFSRGAAFLIVACILPIVGWLAFGPLLYLAAIGAGCKAAFSRVGHSSGITHAETA